MNPSPWFFLGSNYIELESRSEELQGAHEVGGAPRGEGRAPHPRGQGVGPLVFIFCKDFLLFPNRRSVEFQVIPRTSISAQKEHHGSSAENSVSPGLVSFKSCKLESKTRGKALGKVDTLETYQLPQA